MPIEVFSIGPLETNCYLIHQEGTAIAVDPGGDPKPVLDFIEKNALTLAGICLTHLHFDHLYGVADLQTATSAPVFAPTDDAYLLEEASGRGGMWGFPEVKTFDFTPLTAGEHTLGKVNFIALHTPGHTPGSISLYFPSLSAVCTGDALFYRSIGRTDLPGGEHDTLINSITQKLLTLPPETTVYPGHGMESTVGGEKNNNPYCGSFAR